MIDPRKEHMRRLAESLAAMREDQKQERIRLAKWLLGISTVLDGVESIGAVKIPEFWHERMKRASEIISNIDDTKEGRKDE